jgi:S-disulfanyl-L-cysteine oxidoreductase SoxD
MSKSDRRPAALLAIVLLAFALPAFAQHKNYHLGRKATAAEIAGWNIDVRPDGKGLPPGSGSVAQGEKVYESHCSVCHGSFGESNEYLALTNVGERLNYATTLYDYINRAMPFPHSKSLTHDQVYAAVAYVLNLNNIVDSDFVANRETLPKVKAPTRDTMKPYPPMMHIRGKSKVQNTACMRNCAKDVKVTSSLPKGFVKNMYGDISDNFRGLETMNERQPPADELPAGSTTAVKTGTKTAAADPAPQLIHKYGCVACHSVDHKIVGPAFREVAAHYQGKADAVTHLTHKIRHGGSGVWGQIPMPPQVGPSDKELADIIHWVLAQKPAGKKSP